jgi:peptide/nickel transport system permease protein
VLQYFVKRLVLTLPTLLGVAVVVFVLMRLLPGDVVEVRLAAEGAYVTPQTIALERERLGLDQPVWRQFIDWMWGLLHLDFGFSMWTGRPISQEIGVRIGLSLQVAVMATVIAIVLAIPLGTLAALRQDTWVDYAVRVFSIAGLATPSFWLGILLILGLLALFEWASP